MDLSAVTVDSSAVRLSWSPPYRELGNITQYVIKWYSGEVVQNGSTTVSTEILQHTVTGLVECEDYAFYVRAVNGAGDGDEAYTIGSPMTEGTFFSSNFIFR